MSATEPQAKTWVSQVCVEWALDDAPCPAVALSTLIAIARRAGNDGKGSWQSVPTLMLKTGKSESQVRRDINLLKAEKLIKPGDQSLVKHLGGTRPVVYDLVLTNIGPKPQQASPNPTGRKKPKAESPSTDATPSTGATPGIHATPEVAPVLGQGWHGCSPRGSTGATQTRSEEDLEEEGLEEQDQNQNPLALDVIDPKRVDAGEDRGEDPTEFAPDPENEARRLAAIYRDHLTGAQRGLLRAHAIAAFDRGWTFAGLAELLAEKLPPRADNVGAVLIARVRDCDVPPPPADPNDDIPCPIGGHYDYDADDGHGQQYRALKCAACWSEVRARTDPFKGRHERRHPEWTAVYGFNPPAAEPDGLPDDPVDRADQLAAILSAYLDASGIPADPEVKGFEQVGAGEVDPWRGGV